MDCGQNTNCTLSRVIQREDYKNREIRSAPLPTAYDKTATDFFWVLNCIVITY